jgi:uncharacterized membrane protein YeaQ/YmgE (transglycosylase-associated protein family)
LSYADEAALVSILTTASGQPPWSLIISKRTAKIESQVKMSKYFYLCLKSKQKMDAGEILNILLMIGIGAIAGTLAARIVKKRKYSFIVNTLLGIAGAIVGGYIFGLLNLTPGKHITQMISDTFGVNLPQDFMGKIVSALVGAILILLLSNFVTRNRDRDPE